jgi:CubicO group peptidase (beta-lactamase class C family)
MFRILSLRIGSRENPMKQILLIFSAFLFSTAVFAQGFDRDRLEVLHRTTRRFIDHGKHAGIITLLAYNGKIVDFQTYGYRDLENRLPMEPNTICRIYSMSKIITSVAALILWEEGWFNLDDSAETYLPELKGRKVFKGGSAESPELADAARPITIKHLLTHTSGLIYDFDEKDPLGKIYKQADLWSAPNLDAFMKKVAELPLKHQPGDQYSYGINTDLLGALVERISQKKFSVFLQERIFEQLGMKDTGFDVPAEKMNRLAKTYKQGTDGKLVEAELLIGTSPAPGVESGGGGLFSTAGDYFRVAQMLLNNGSFGGKRILGRKTVELMTANHLLSLPDQAEVAKRPQGFGLGVEVQQDLGRSGVAASRGAFGWYGAATTYARIDPHEKIVAIALAQHFPFNEHNFFAKFATGYYQALK